jgi:fructoselysine-6-phosphate deglycase
MGTLWNEQDPKLISFDEKETADSINGALALRGEIERIIDAIWADGFDNIFFFGIGGTWASGMQTEVYMRGRSALPIFVENASEFLTTGNKRFTKKSVAIYSSVSGNTAELVEAVKVIKSIGAKVFSFIDTPNTPLASKELSDYCIVYPKNEQLKLYMTANYLMYKNGDFPEYERYNLEMETSLAAALIEAEKKADDFGKEFAKQQIEFLKGHPEIPRYFIGCGNHWGATYSYAMCYWEEQMWIHTKSVSCPEFFHGTLEIIERDTPVTLFIGEDEQRPLAERVARFLPKICANYTIIDTKDYELKGISEEFRGSISHLVLRAVNNRVDMYMERELRHPLQIRRYYRQFEY